MTLEGAFPFMLALTGTAGGLLGRYIGSKVDRLARERIEIELARIKLENDKLIEAIRSIERRRSTEEDRVVVIDRADSGDSGERERADVALLQRIWGMDEQDAHDLLRATGMNVERAIDAWLEAGEHLAKNRADGNAIPRGERLAIATRFAKERR